MSGGIGHLVLSGPLILAVPVAAAAGAVTFLSPCVLPWSPATCPTWPACPGSMRRPPAAGDGHPAGTGSTAAARSTVAAGSTAATDTRTAAAGGPAPGSGGGGTAVKAPAAAVAAGPPAPDRGRPRPVRARLLGRIRHRGRGVRRARLGPADPVAGLTQILGGLTIILGLLFAGVFDRFPRHRADHPAFRAPAGRAGGRAGARGAVRAELDALHRAHPRLVMGLALTSGTAVRGALLMFVYGLGLGIPFLIVALLFQRGMTAFGFARRHARLITRVGGAMLVAVGVLELTGTWTAAMQWVQTHWIANVKSPLSPGQALQAAAQATLVASGLGLASGSQGVPVHTRSTQDCGEKT